MKPNDPGWHASSAGPAGAGPTGAGPMGAGPTAGASKALPHEAESPRVLLISDDPAERTQVRALLQEAARLEMPLGDVSLDCAGDDRQAAILAADIDYVAVLLGHLGTAADRGKLIEQLRQSGALPDPFIVLAGADDGTRMRAALAAGAVDVLALDDISAAALERTLRYALTLHRAETRAAGLELFDSASGLARQPLLWEMLSLAVRRARRNKDYLAVLLLHLDCIEQPMGGPEGRPGNRSGVDPLSTVIPLVSRRLTRLLRASDTIALLDDGHLAILVESMPRAEDIQTVAEKVITAAAGRYELDGRRFDLAVNVGIALYPTSAADAATLMRAAAAAALTARDKGENEFHFG